MDNTYPITAQIKPQIDDIHIKTVQQWRSVDNICSQAAEQWIYRGVKLAKKWTKKAPPVAGSAVGGVTVVAVCGVSLYLSEQ